MAQTQTNGSGNGATPGINGKAYPIVDHTFDVVIVGAGGAGLRAAIDNGDPEIKGARRAKLEAASAYLDVAPRVVNVVRDMQLPADLVTSLPKQIADPERLDELVEEFGIGGSVGRVTKALSIA